MNTQCQLKRFFAPLAVGFGLALGVGTVAEAFPDNSRTIHYDNSGYHQNYHRRSFRNVQPFRSLNVTPRYHIPSPADSKYYNHHRYQHSHYGDRYYRGHNYHYRGRYEGDQRYGETNSGRNRVRRVRRVDRRGFRIDTNGVEGSR